MAEPKRPGWRDWYHVTAGTYAKWLPGDERGWRERNHHEHVPGDYKNPPPKTRLSKGRHAHAKSILRSEPRVFFPRERTRIGAILLESFAHQEIAVLALAVTATNIHVLVQCRDRRPKWRIGQAKEHVTFGHARIIDHALGEREKLWEKGSCAMPITDRAHAVRVFRYILKHAEQGAWIWSFRQPRLDVSVTSRGASPGPRPRRGRA